MSSLNPVDLPATFASSKIMLTRELGDPFRRDAMKLPKRHLKKYQNTIQSDESATGQPVDLWAHWMWKWRIWFYLMRKSSPSPLDWTNSLDLKIVGELTGCECSGIVNRLQKWISELCLVLNISFNNTLGNLWKVL
jgi:hypothetical protein